MAAPHAPAPPAKGPAPGKGSAPAPNWLAPQSQAQITKQATSTVSKAFAPALQSINTQESQQKAISDKRSSDNKYYQSWLNMNMDALQAHADAAHQDILNTINSVNTTTNGLYGQGGSEQTGLVAGADARTGNVSNNSQSNAFGQQLLSTQKADQTLLSGAQHQALVGADSENNQLASTRANNTAFIAGTESKQLGDLQTAMNKFETTRTSTKATEAADIQKEITRLQGVELQKAQSNRNYAAALEKLGLTAANVQSEISTRQQNANTAATNAKTNQTRAQTGIQQLRLSQQRLKLDINNAQFNQMMKDKQFNLNVAKYDAQTAKDLYERSHGLGPYKPSKSGQTAALPLASQNVIFNHINQTAGELNSLIGRGMDPKTAYGAVLAGFYTIQQNGKTVRVPVTPQHDQSLLNAAYNSRSGGSGLTAGDVAWLQKQGVTNISGRLRVA